VGGRTAEASGVIRAVREPYLTGRERRGSAPGRAAGGQRRIPRIARPSEHLVECRAARAELRRVRLCDDNATLALDTLHHWVRGLRHMVLENRRAVGRAHTSDIGQAFDGDRQTAEPTRLPFGFATLSARKAPGGLACAIEA